VAAGDEAADARVETPITLKPQTLTKPCDRERRDERQWLAMALQAAGGTTMDARPKSPTPSFLPSSPTHT